MRKLSGKLAIMFLIIVFTIGGIPGKFDSWIGGGLSVAAAATIIPSQDGIGYSGSIPANEVVGTTFTGYQEWPNGFSKGSSAFAGGVYDGTSIWMIPYNANELIKVDPSTGEMTSYNNWPAGFTKGGNAFVGGVYDGTNIWLIPYSANQVVKVNATTGVMTGYSGWPGESRGSDQFMGGTFDGTNIWLTPYYGSRLIKVDTTNGAMTSYNSWPSGTTLGSYPFYGSIFDGTSIWLIPNGADRLIKVDPTNGVMTGFSNWPSGFTKSADTFSGGVFDGTNIWLIPNNATHVVKINTATGDMTGYNEWPSGFTKGSGSFAGGVYDGTNIWLVPLSADRLIKVNAATGEMTGFNNWPSGFTKGNSAFMGGVYDGKNVWMIPFMADRLMKFGASSNANLSSLTSDGATLNPVFAPGTSSYTVNVAHGVSALTVTPTAADAGATVKVNGTTVPSGTASSAFHLSVGDNPITVEVAAQDGTTTRTYTLTVTRAAAPLSTNASLSSLTLSDGGILNPAFAPGTASYTANVAHGVSALTVTPTAADAGATVMVNGTAVTSGTASSAIHLSVGDNPITVEVTAADGTTTQTYTLTVTRAAAPLSTNASLSSLALSDGGILNPAFAPGTVSYTANVAHGVSALTVTPTAADAGATVMVNGTAVTSGTASSAIHLSVGDNPITVEVTAADGTTTQTYTVIMTRAAAISSGGSSSPTGSDDGKDGKVVTSTDGKLTVPVGSAGEMSLPGEMTIVLPAGASDKELIITIEKLMDTKALLSDQEILISPVYEILKNVTDNFIKPVTLTFVFDAASLKKDQRPVVFYYDEVKKEWVQIDGGKVEVNKINVEVDHFTKFAVMAVSMEEEESEPDQPTFSDISGHWAVSDINKAVQIGIVNGYENGTFKPNGVVTRAEFVTMLMKALKPQEEAASLMFTDSAKIGTWAQQAVEHAVQLDVVKGYSDGSFRPDAEITRTEMAVMITKALALRVEINAVTDFMDDAEIPNWAKGQVAALKKLGLISGKGNNEFAPNDRATRAEAVTILLKMIAQKSK